MLTPPPIISAKEDFNTCAVHHHIFYEDSNAKHGSNKSVGRFGRFSRKEVDRGFYRYSCEVDEWFPVPEKKIEQSFSCLANDDNLVYSIGGDLMTPRKLVQAFDYRTAAWMKLPDSLFSHWLFSRSCALNGKVYVYNEKDIEMFDYKAGKWQKLESPLRRNDSGRYLKLSSMKMSSYENMLWIIMADNKPKYPVAKVATYNFVSQEWNISRLQNREVNSLLEENRSYYDWDINDVITFEIKVS